jgi:hypothetical protein
MNAKTPRQNQKRKSGVSAVLLGGSQLGVLATWRSLKIFSEV